MHMYLSITVLAQVRSVQSDTSATVQRQYAHEESAKRYIWNSTAPVCAWGESKAIHLQQYSATMRMRKVQSDTSVRTQIHYRNAINPKPHIRKNAGLPKQQDTCENTASLHGSSAIVLWCSHITLLRFNISWRSYWLYGWYSWSCFFLIETSVSGTGLHLRPHVGPSGQN
jgi:hypothetical protein